MRGLNQYKSMRVESASGPRLVALLLEEAIRRVDRGSVEIAAGGQPAADLARARDILTELSCALDYAAAPELCGRLAGLYRWMLVEISTASREREATKLDPVRACLVSLLDGWREAAKKVA